MNNVTDQESVDQNIQITTWLSGATKSHILSKRSQH